MNQQQITKILEGKNAKSDNPYTRLRSYEISDEEYFAFLERYRFDHPSLMLAYWLEKVRIEYNWSNSDVAERANLSRAAISSILNGHTSATAGTWASIARAVGANPLEFFIAEGWVYSADVATYVENADTRELQTLGVILEEIDPKHHQAFIKMVSAVADTLKIR